ncbi:MAG TPA: phosphoribosylamine--glycine ligase [Vicinamibacterales bacterium]|nr:phosphoribosylamine--glycine ligase [Vicinamibacterales bacterium]
MKVLVLGAGGREHALAWRLSRDPDHPEIITAPGNPGMASVGRVFDVDPLNPDAVAALVERERVDLTVVGPEAPLEKGLADRFRVLGLPVVGPSSLGAALECSKAHAKAFMLEHRIPTARFVVCDTAEAALAALDDFGTPVVVKADGLAAGKGVTVASSRQEAEAAIRAAIVDRLFGDAGSRVVIEECLTGPEVSLFYLSDGRTAIPLGSAQDHKRIFDEDRGPNTGGMGAFAPSPLATAELVDDITRRVVQPVLDGHRAMGSEYTGFLYVSLMLTGDGPKVIEFNVRFGDPEAQVVLPLLEGNLTELLYAAATSALGNRTLAEPEDKAVGVVLASRGYPATSESGRPILGIGRASAVPGVTVFHAGTRISGDELVTAGGRVLTVTARASGFQKAIDVAYQAVSAIQFEGMQFRRDIGQKALAGRT